MPAANHHHEVMPLVDPVVLQARLARARINHAKSVEAVERYRQQLTRSYGVKIEFEEGPHAPFNATTQLSWHHDRNRHVVLLHPPYEAFHEPHLRAHELGHIELASETHKVWGRVPRVAVKVAIDREKLSEKAVQTGIVSEPEMLAIESELSAEDRWKRRIATVAFDRILDMLVEQRVRDNTGLKVLSAAQFISLQAQMQARIHELKSYRRFSFAGLKAQLPPENLTTPSLAVNFAYAFFLDRLLGKFTRYYAVFCTTVDNDSAKMLAEAIFDFVQGRIASLNAGGEYGLVDDVMKMAGLDELYGWS
jgi:hypothetical protein